MEIREDLLDFEDPPRGAIPPVGEGVVAAPVPAQSGTENTNVKRIPSNTTGRKNPDHTSYFLRSGGPPERTSQLKISPQEYTQKRKCDIPKDNPGTKVGSDGSEKENREPMKKYWQPGKRR